MLFQYKAIKDGIEIVRRIEAQDEDSVVAYLKENGYIPITVTPARRIDIDLGDLVKLPREKLSAVDVVDFTRQLAIMLNAGLTLIDALKIFKKQVTKKSMLRVVDVIDEQIRAGNSLSTALKMFPNYFSSMYVALVRAGEASGKLSEILLRLAENLEKDREIKGKLKSALIYPGIIILSMIIVIFIMLTFVLPKLLNFYQEFNIKLPASTQFLIFISTFSAKFWPIIILVVVTGVVLLRRYIKSKQGRLLFDTLSLRIPVISNILKMSALVDSTRTLSLLVGAGVSILESLNIIIETTENVVFQQSYRNILKNVEKGVSLGSALSYEGVFPPIFVQMTIVGESTGNLDDTLLRLSKYFEMESEIAIKTMTTLIEPIILIILGVGVGFLVVSVITPIYNFTSSFQ